MDIVCEVALWMEKYLHQLETGINARTLGKPVQQKNIVQRQKEQEKILAIAEEAAAKDKVEHKKVELRARLERQREEKKQKDRVKLQKENRVKQAEEESKQRQVEREKEVAKGIAQRF